MAEYINKHWTEEVIKKRLDNLKKVIVPFIVDMEIHRAEAIADNRLDALYIAYYKLKDDFCKLKRSSFGKPKVVEYRQKALRYYSNYDPIEWTWAVSPGTWNTTSTTAASSSATYYNYSNWIR